MKLFTIFLIVTILINSSISSKLKRIQNNVSNTKAKSNDKIFDITLSKSDQKDEVFGKVDIWKGDDGLQVMKLVDQPPVPNSDYEAKCSIGILKTEKFYFLFPWETCVDNDKLDFSKLTGLLELAHGTNERFLFNLNPFTPPGKKLWKLHHTAPFGSISVGKTDYQMLISRIFSSSIIDFSNDEPTGTHTLWDIDDNKEVTAEHESGIHTGKKFSESRKKYISGTNNPNNNNKIMNLELSKFRTDEKFKKEHLPEMLGAVRISTTVGYVITRNRKFKKAYLSNMLTDIVDYGFPTNLVISSCRYRNPDKNWDEGWNQGPKAFFVLGMPNKTQKRPTWEKGEAIGKEVTFTK